MNQVVVDLCLRVRGDDGKKVLATLKQILSEAPAHAAARIEPLVIDLLVLELRREADQPSLEPRKKRLRRHYRDILKHAGWLVGLAERHERALTLYVRQAGYPFKSPEERQAWRDKLTALVGWARAADRQLAPIGPPKSPSKKMLQEAVASAFWFAGADVTGRVACRVLVGCYHLVTREHIHLSSAAARLSDAARGLDDEPGPRATPRRAKATLPKGRRSPRLPGSTVRRAPRKGP